MGSAALAAYAELIDVTERPKGVAPRQWRLALLYPRCKTAVEALIAAGYTENVAKAQARRTLDAVGVSIATRHLRVTQADRARGFMAISAMAVENAKADLDDLAPRDRLAVAFKAAELAHAIGENVETSGNASAWKQRQRRAIRLAYYLGQRSMSRVPPAPVVSTQE